MRRDELRELDLIAGRGIRAPTESSGEQPGAIAHAARDGRAGGLALHVGLTAAIPRVEAPRGGQPRAAQRGAEVGNERRQRRVRRSTARRAVVVHVVFFLVLLRRLLRRLRHGDESLERGFHDRRERRGGRRGPRGRRSRQRRRQRVGQVSRPAVLGRNLRRHGDETQRAERARVLLLLAGGVVHRGGRGGQQGLPVLRPTARVERGGDGGSRGASKSGLGFTHGIHEGGEQRRVRGLLGERPGVGEFAQRPARGGSHGAPGDRRRVNRAGSQNRKDPLPGERARGRLAAVVRHPLAQRAVRDEHAEVGRLGRPVVGRAGSAGRPETFKVTQRRVARGRADPLLPLRPRGAPAPLLALPPVVTPAPRADPRAAALGEQPQQVRRGLPRRVELLVEPRRIVGIRREVLLQVLLLVLLPVSLVLGAGAQRGVDGGLQQTPKVGSEELVPGRRLRDAREEIEAERALSRLHSRGGRVGSGREPSRSQRGRQSRRVRAHRGEELVHVSPVPRHQRLHRLDNALDGFAPRRVNALILESKRRRLLQNLGQNLEPPL